MIFFTPDWYRDLQVSTLGGALHADPRAARADDAYYRVRYDKWIEEQLAYERRVAAMSFEDCFPVPVKADMKYLRGEEIAAVKAEYEANLPEYRRMYAARPPYDEARLREEYARAAAEEEAKLRDLLPPEILAGVPDLRLLAVGVADPRTAAAVRAFSRAAEERVEGVLAAYDRHYAEIADALPEALTSERLDLHDACVLSFTRTDDRAEMTFDCTRCYSKLSSLTLEGVSAAEGDPTGAFWLYDEVDTAGDGFSLGVLLLREDGTPATFSCTFAAARAAHGTQD